MSRRRLAATIFLSIVVSTLSACDEPSGDAPYFEIVGGGFIFNIRLADAYYGFVLRLKRDLPAGAILEASFEDPAGGPAIVVRQIHRTHLRGYKFETPPLHGIKADTDYKVIIRALAPAGDKVIASLSKTFRTYTDQSSLPKQPLSVGPGYQPNPRAN